ncbi:MAG: hypothetical protein AB2A00_18410 [Myxococcota bacterium]
MRLALMASCAVLLLGCRSGTDRLIDSLALGPASPGAPEKLQSLGAQPDRDEKLAARITSGDNQACANAAELLGVYAFQGPNPATSYRTLLDLVPRTRGPCAIQLLANLLQACGKDGAAEAVVCAHALEDVLHVDLSDEHVVMLSDYLRPARTERLLPLLDLSGCKKPAEHTRNLLRVVDKMADRGDALVLMGLGKPHTLGVACAYALQLGARGEGILKLVDETIRTGCQGARAASATSSPDGGTGRP